MVWCSYGRWLHLTSSVIQPWDVWFRGCGLLSQLIQTDKKKREAAKTIVFHGHLYWVGIRFPIAVINTLANAFYDEHVWYRVQHTFLWESKFFTLRNVTFTMKHIPSSCLLLFAFYLPSEGTCIWFKPPSHISGYFWIRNFFFADSPVSVNTYPVNKECESASFWICSPQWTCLNTWIQNRVDAKSRYFFYPVT